MLDFKIGVVQFGCSLIHIHLEQCDIYLTEFSKHTTIKIITKLLRFHGPFKKVNNHLITVSTEIINLLHSMRQTGDE